MWIIRIYEEGSDYCNFRQGSSQDMFDYDPSVPHSERTKKIREEMKEYVFKQYKDELIKKFEELGKKIERFEIYIHGVREVDSWESVRGSFVIPVTES
jgi:hypothetical protein